MARIYLVSLGCDKNAIDAEIMAKTLADAGHTFSADPFQSDLALVNTCGFIEASKKESIDAVFDMARLKEDKKSDIRAVVVTGCLAERYRGEFARLLPEADAVAGLGKNAQIAHTVDAALAGVRFSAFGDPKTLPLEGERLRTGPSHYAYLKIL